MTFCFIRARGLIKEVIYLNLKNDIEGFFFGAKEIDIYDSVP